jgi:hypothetical protein
MQLLVAQMSGIAGTLNGITGIIKCGALRHI